MYAFNAAALTSNDLYSSPFTFTFNWNAGEFEAVLFSTFMASFAVCPFTTFSGAESATEMSFFFSSRMVMLSIAVSIFAVGEVKRKRNTMYLSLAYLFRLAYFVFHPHTPEFTALLVSTVSTVPSGFTTSSVSGTSPCWLIYCENVTTGFSTPPSAILWETSEHSSFSVPAMNPKHPLSPSDEVSMASVSSP